jgi:hypothetical protein
VRLLGRSKALELKGFTRDGARPVGLDEPRMFDDWPLATTLTRRAPLIV